MEKGTSRASESTARDEGKREREGREREREREHVAVYPCVSREFRECVHRRRTRADAKVV